MGASRKPKPDRITVGYIRVSHHEQVQSGLSLDNQRIKIEACALIRNTTLAEIYTDEGISAKDMKRPGLQVVLSGIKDGTIGAVIIYKLDRLTRSIRDLGEILDLIDKHNVDLASVMETIDTGTAAGKLVIHMVGVIAEWERNTISERTLDAIAVKRSRGERLGGKMPYGYKSGSPGLLVPVSHEIEVIERMIALYKEGMGYAGIARQLEAAGIATKSRTGTWRASTIKGIISRASKHAP